MDKRLTLLILIAQKRPAGQQLMRTGPNPDKVNPQPFNTRTQSWVTSSATANMLGICRRKIHAATKLGIERYCLMSWLRPTSN